MAGSTFGNGHIKTFDGLLYDYNGIGEYWLIYSTLLSVQGRTIVALKPTLGYPWNGANASVSLFSAFAIQVPATGLVPSDRVHVQMDIQRQSMQF